jgi:hypothetical protein
MKWGYLGWRTWLVFFAGLFLMVAPVFAQDDPGDGRAFAEVQLGNHAFSINTEEALSACITGQDLITGSVTLQLFVNVNGIGPIPGQSFNPPMVGALEDANIDDCFILADEPVPESNN